MTGTSSPPGWVVSTAAPHLNLSFWYYLQSYQALLPAIFQHKIVNSATESVKRHLCHEMVVLWLFSDGLSELGEGEDGLRTSVDTSSSCASKRKARTATLSTHSSPSDTRGAALIRVHNRKAMAGIPFGWYSICWALIWSTCIGLLSHIQHGTSSTHTPISDIPSGHAG